MYDRVRYNTYINQQTVPIVPPMHSAHLSSVSRSGKMRLVCVRVLSDDGNVNSLAIKVIKIALAYDFIASNILYQQIITMKHLVTFVLQATPFTCFNIFLFNVIFAFKFYLSLVQDVIEIPSFDSTFSVVNRFLEFVSYISPIISYFCSLKTHLEWSRSVKNWLLLVFDCNCMWKLIEKTIKTFYSCVNHY